MESKPSLITAKFFAVVLLGIAVYSVNYALGLKMFFAGGPGAGLFPFAIGIALGVTALLWLFQLWISGTEEASLPSVPDLFRIVSQLAALVAFTLLLPAVGYVVSAFLLVVCTALLAGERKWHWLLLVAVLASFGVKYGFSLLGTHL